MTLFWYNILICAQRPRPVREREVIARACWPYHDTQIRDIGFIAGDCGAFAMSQSFLNS
jgi:hypothetical protein